MRNARQRSRSATALVLVVVGLLAACTTEPAGAPTPTTERPSGVQPRPPAPTAEPGAGGPDRLTVVATGDVLLHERLWTTARRDGGGRWDFAPLMAPIKPLVESADLALCHLETPLAKAGGPYSGYPLFDGPPQIATALKQTGYDACTTASNHSFDRGAAGVDRTLATLEQAGLEHAGTARSPQEAATPTVLDVRGVKVALLSYTYGFNGMPYPLGQTWRAGTLEAAAIRAQAKKARDAGAQIVIVACHWGDEYQHRPNAQQRDLAPKLVADGNIDLVIGHHAHVVQPLQKVGDEWVSYGAGNMIAAHRTPGAANSEGLLTRFTFARKPDGRWSVAKAEYAALLITDPVPMRLLDVRHELGKPAISPALRARLQTALRRTETVVKSLGAGKAGATPIVR